MSFSVNIILRKDKTSHKTGEVPLCLLVIKDKQKKQKKICNIHPKYWDEDKQRVRKSHPQANELNALIADQKAVFTKQMLQNPDSFGVTALQTACNKGASTDIFQYAEDCALKLIEQERIPMAERYRSVFRKLKAYKHYTVLPIGNITTAYLEDYRNYLTKKGNQINTIASNFKVISAVVNRMYVSLKLDPRSNPFIGFKNKSERKERVSLTEQELRKLEEYELEPWSQMYFVRAVFLFECYSGLRVADILTIRWKECTRGYIIKKIRKTQKVDKYPLLSNIRKIRSQQRKYLEMHQRPIDPEARVFDWLGDNFDNLTPTEQYRKIKSVEVILNRQLKVLAAQVGISKNISTHIGRHTYASMLLSHGVDIYVVKELLGHASVKTTEIYARLNDQTKCNAVNTVDDKLNL